MAIIKSPFYVVQGFLSRKLCEHIIDQYGFDTDPDIDSDGNPQKMIKHVDYVEELTYQRFMPLIPQLQQHYEFEYRGTEDIMIELYPQGYQGVPVCDNSDFLRKSWVRTRDRDFSAMIFLSDYCDEVPFDSDYEVYGGKFEFIQHGFGFMPTMGTLIVYPSGPHFVNAFANVEAGDLYTIKFYFTSKLPYLYQPSNFPGDFRSWFNEE